MNQTIFDPKVWFISNHDVEYESSCSATWGCTESGYGDGLMSSVGRSSEGEERERERERDEISGADGEMACIWVRAAAGDLHHAHRSRAAALLLAAAHGHHAGSVRVALQVTYKPK